MTLLLILSHVALLAAGIWWGRYQYKKGEKHALEQASRAWARNEERQHELARLTDRFRGRMEITG